jgi:hypothetical protein
VADIAVLDGDILETRPARLTNLEVAATILGGRVVYERRGSGRLAAASAAAAAAGITPADADRARACLHAGVCCCTLARETFAGRL